ncbi:MAG: HTTM domain-containing protein [Sediminicola sp.]
MLDRFLFTRIDNSPLLIFRVFFGILISLECYGAIFTGWVRRTLVEPLFTFTFIGFEWLQPLQGNGMYFYFAIMGTLGVLIALGYRYRASMIAFTLMWTTVYLMQKTSYNNHYYLLILISFLMIFLPAHNDRSLDVRRKPFIKKDSMPSYIKWIIVLQLLIVYTYASIAKLYGDWLDFGVIQLLMRSKAGYPLVGELLQHPWAHAFIGISGIIFDLLVVPALLWRPTRKIAFFLSIFFHLFNGIIFQIGIFPFLSLAFSVFFFPPETIRRIFFPKRIPFTDTKVVVNPQKSALLLCLGIYFVIQLALPLRHHLFKDDVLWTEEGHRMSWRMMLRSRSGTVQFRIVDKDNGKSEFVRLDDYLTFKQKRKIASYPDFMWQFAQRLKKENAEMGRDIEVYVTSKVSINGKPARTFIDPKVDLAAAKWRHFAHNDWILPSE